MIEFRNVSIGYSRPLAKITLEKLVPGHMYALIGSNGSGKSTFLRTICGRQQPISGSIIINGKTVSEMNRQELAATIAFVPSKFPDSDFMSAIDFISLGRTPYLNHMGRLSEKDLAIVEQVINQVGISHLKHNYTSQLSDGERQLCAVARALAQQTPVILLDEPTGFLDYRNKRRLLELLEQLVKQLNITILFSTHDIETIRYSDIQLIGIEAGASGESRLGLIDETLSFEHLVNRYYN